LQGLKAEAGIIVVDKVECGVVVAGRCLHSACGAAGAALDDWWSGLR
jgi:hypothetical protein